MSLFQLRIAVPKTGTINAFSAVINEEDQVVERIEVELSKEKQAISHMSVTMFDPDLTLFGKIPDDAFADVPVQLYLSEGKQTTPKLVFDGIVTRLGAHHPEDKFELVAQDKGVTMRRTQTRLRALKGLTPTDLAKKIAAEYGLDVDIDVGDAQLTPIAAFIGVAPMGSKALSDWAYMQGALAAVGLYVHCQGSKLVIRQTPTAIYPTTFKKGGGNIIGLQANINHVRGPGDLGNMKTQPAFEDKTTIKSVSGKDAKDAAAQKGGQAVTGRIPRQGQAADSKGSHIEDTRAAKWSNQVTQRRGRKDDGVLEVNTAPGVLLEHLINIDGFGAKIDGYWEVKQVKHMVIPSEGGGTTTISMTRGTSAGGAAAGGVAFETQATKKAAR